MSDKGDLQDGMLAHYQAQARASDANVEARLDREPFDYRDVLRQALPAMRRDAETCGRHKWPPKA